MKQQISAIVMSLMMGSVCAGISCTTKPAQASPEPIGTTGTVGSPVADADGTVHGQVLVGGAPVAGSTVTLWQASAAAPQRLADAKTDDHGRFEMPRMSAGSDAIRYLIAAGGEPKAGKGGNSAALALLAVLGSKTRGRVIVNELTTVASAFTAARFIRGEAISGNPLGLRIAAMNVPNLVNLQSGSWGSVIVDGLNITRSTTLSNFDTLASLVTYASTSAGDDWRARFFQAATPAGGTTPSNTLEAMAGIAREPWAHPKDLFTLFEEAYPQAKEGLPNAAPFAPYLLYAPSDFALVLRFSGGGLYAPGRLMFDADGNLWSGVNWMPGSQSNAVKNIGGGAVKFGPDGSALSPPVTGFMGAGINGVGWGTAVTRDNVLITSFNGKILVMDLQAVPWRASRTFRFARSCTASWASASRRTAMSGSRTARAVNCSFPRRTCERGAHRQSRRPRGAVRCRHR